MKKVTIDGKEYEVPDNSNWIAMDSDGAWWWYEEEPELNRHYCWDVDGDLGLINEMPNAWRNTKRRI